jgi:hypothetical protein
MWRGLLALFLLLTAIYAFAVVMVIGTWASSHVTGLISLAATCLWLALGCTAVVVIWAGAYAISPGPTKYLSVLGLIGVVLLSLLSMWILRGREEARRTAAMNNLRQIALEVHRAGDVRPGVDPAFDPERLVPLWVREPSSGSRGLEAWRPGPPLFITPDPPPTGQSSAASRP